MKGFVGRVYYWWNQPNRIDNLRAFLSARWKVYRPEKWRLCREVRRQQSQISVSRQNGSPVLFSLSENPLVDGEFKYNQKIDFDTNETFKKLQFEEEVLFIAKNTPRESIIIDVGSNIGTFTEFFLKRGYTVISIEPLRGNVYKQAPKFSTYIEDGKLYLYNIACSDKVGNSILFVSSDPDGAFSSLEGRWTTDVFRGCWSGKTELIETFRLSDMLNHYSGEGEISCIKIDTEGHDDEVIAGLFDGLHQNRFPMFIMFEFHTKQITQPSFKRCISLLDKNGYPEVQYFV